MVMSAEENSCCRMIKPMRRRSLHIPRNPGPNGRKGVRGFPANSSYLQLPCTEIAGDPVYHRRSHQPQQAGLSRRWSAFRIARVEEHPVETRRTRHPCEQGFSFEMLYPSVKTISTHGRGHARSGEVGPVDIPDFQEIWSRLEEIIRSGITVRTLARGVPNHLQWLNEGIAVTTKRGREVLPRE